MPARAIALCLAVSALAGCRTLADVAPENAPAAAASSLETRYISYEGSHVALSWTSTSARLNYEASLAVSNAEIIELVSSETGCEAGTPSAPSLIGDRVTLSIPLTCAAPAAAPAQSPSAAETDEAGEDDEAS